MTDRPQNPSDGPSSDPLTPSPEPAPGERAPDAPAGRDGLVVVESCTTTWAFDTGRARFARLPRGLALSNSSAEWRPYASMNIDRDGASVEVALDAQGTRLLRSEIHTGAPCPDCGHPGSSVV